MYYSKTWKQCATCAFWCGPRGTDHWADNVEVENTNTMGKCGIPSGGWKGVQMAASATCNSWQKWPVLK